jgi:methyl-accepting chemotaxis protein
MTFRRSAPAALIAVVIVVIVALTALSERLFSGITSEIEAGQFQLMQAILETAIRNASDEALARADIVAALPVTKHAVAAKDRERLLAEFSDMFAIQKDRRGVDQAQFHVPPVQSLLRLHTPSAFGDDLTRFRPLIVAAHREQAARKGLAIARRGPAIFGVAPIHDTQGKFIGTFEFGLDFAPVLAGLKAAYGLDFTLFVEEKPLREFARGLDPAVLGEQNRMGRFIRFFTTNAALMRSLAVEGDIAAVSEPTRYTRDAQGVPYGVLLMPLRDGAGDPIGVVAVARDFSGSRAAAGRSLVWQICLAVFAIVILAGAIITVIRGFVLRPLDALNARFAELASGRRLEPLEGTDNFSVELQPLVQLQERMRTQRVAGAMP